MTPTQQIIMCMLASLTSSAPLMDKHLLMSITPLGMEVWYLLLEQQKERKKERSKLDKSERVSRHTVTCEGNDWQTRAKTKRDMEYCCMQNVRDRLTLS